MPAPAVMCLVSCVCVCSNFGSTVYIHERNSFFYVSAGNMNDSFDSSLFVLLPIAIV